MIFRSLCSVQKDQRGPHSWAYELSYLVTRECCTDGRASRPSVTLSWLLTRPRLASIRAEVTVLKTPRGSVSPTSQTNTRKAPRVSANGSSKHGKGRVCLPATELTPERRDGWVCTTQKEPNRTSLLSLGHMGPKGRSGLGGLVHTERASPAGSSKPANQYL